MTTAASASVFVLDETAWQPLGAALSLNGPVFGQPVLAVPADNAQSAADDLIDAGVRIIFNYSEALLDTPSDVAVHTSNPAVELLYALYFHLT